MTYIVRQLFTLNIRVTIGPPAAGRQAHISARFMGEPVHLHPLSNSIPGRTHITHRKTVSTSIPDFTHPSSNSINSFHIMSSRKRTASDRLTNNGDPLLAKKRAREAAKAAASTAGASTASDVTKVKIFICCNPVYCSQIFVDPLRLCRRLRPSKLSIARKTRTTFLKTLHLARSRVC